MSGPKGTCFAATDFSRDLFSDFLFFQKSISMLKPESKQASKPARKQASKEASKQASKPASQQASKQVGKQASQPASKQRKARKGRVYFLSVFLFSSLASVAFVASVASVAFVGWAFVALPFFTCLSIYLI